MLPWSTSVDSTAHRGALATGCIELPSADRGVPTAGGIIFSPAHRGKQATGRVTLPAADRGKVATGLVIFSPQGGKEKRKIPVISLQAIDLPITYNTVLRGYSKPFPAAFLGINLMKSMILIVKCLDEE
jgi:hypothetical protein